MKTIRYTVLLTIFFLSVHVLVAQRSLLTLEDAIVGPYLTHRIQDIPQLQWLPEGHDLSFVKGDSLMEKDPVSGKETLLFTRSRLNKVLDSLFSDPLRRMPSLHWISPGRFWFRRDTTWVVMQYREGKLTTENYIKVPGGSGHFDFCAAAPAVAFTRGQNLFIAEPQGKITQVTFDSLPGYVNGQSVSRNEFGINKGTFWSPDGSSLAYYRKDETRVSNYPLVDIMTRVASLKNIKYPMAGMASEELHVFVYDRKTGKTQEIDTPGPYDQYLTNVTWTPDGHYLLMAVVNREQDHMWMNMYFTQTGKKILTLFEEENERYVEPLKPARFLKGEGSFFLWESRRNGYNHVYLYDLTGKLYGDLTPGTFDVTEVLGFDQEQKYFYYVSTEKSPLERHIYRYEPKKKRKMCLTQVHGTHGGALSPDGKYILDRWSNVETPHVIDVMTTTGRPVVTLLRAPDPWQDKRLGRVELGKLPATDTSPALYYHLIKPVDFDPSKKYPVVIYVYGGPHSQLVTDTWLGQSRMWQHYMAGQGYVSFTLDNRGTGGRGFDFESCIHRHLGDYEVKDQMRGVDYLKSLPWVDPARIGVHGWSYGGFMTLSMMLKDPGVFKAAVAGGPVTDWKYYEVMYGERYMDRPEENPAGYKEADLKNYVNNLDGHVLIIHGAMDSTVVWQHSLTLLRAFIRAGKQVDYFVYPTHPHNVRGWDRIHLMRKVSDYFDEYLKK